MIGFAATSSAPPGPAGAGGWGGGTCAACRANAANSLTGAFSEFSGAPRLCGFRGFAASPGFRGFAASMRWRGPRLPLRWILYLTCLYVQYSHLTNKLYPSSNIPCDVRIGAAGSSMSVDYGLSNEVGVCASMHEPNKPWNIKTITHTSLTGWCPERYVCWFMFIQLTDNKVILKIQRATIVTAPLFSLVQNSYYTPFSSDISDISQQFLLWHTKEKLLGHLPRNPHWIPTKSHPTWKSSYDQLKLCKSRNLEIMEITLEITIFIYHLDLSATSPKKKQTKKTGCACASPWPPWASHPPGRRPWPKNGKQKRRPLRKPVGVITY